MSSLKNNDTTVINTILIEYQEIITCVTIVIIAVFELE